MGVIQGLNRRGFGVLRALFWCASMAKGAAAVIWLGHVFTFWVWPACERCGRAPCVRPAQTPHAHLKRAHVLLSPMCCCKRGLRVKRLLSATSLRSDTVSLISTAFYMCALVAVRA